MTTAKSYLFQLEQRLLPSLIAGIAYAMRRFSAAHEYLAELRTASNFLRLMTLKLTVQCFRASHFLFKIAYRLQQRRLRLLCTDEFFREFYDRSVSSGNPQEVLRSINHIRQGLEGAETVLETKLTATLKSKKMHGR